MNNNVSPLWTSTHEAALTASTQVMDDDFTSFLNFGDMNTVGLGMNAGYDHGGHGHSIHATHDVPMDSDFGLPQGYNISAQDGGRMGEAHGRGGMGMTAGEDYMTMQFDEMEKRMQQVVRNEHYHQQAQQQQRQMQARVPPTPTSMELHGGSAQQAQAQGNVFDRFNTYREELEFTPLISPAVTPLDSEFNPHQAPSEYNSVPFSPLTSPALRANPNHFQTSMAEAAMAMSQTHLPSAAMGSPIIPKTLSGHVRRKSQATPRNPARVIRQSPAIRPQRKKPSNLTMPSSGISLPPASEYSAHTPTGSIHNTPIQYPMSREGSSNESVSPEPLPEVLMAPPPPPAQRIFLDEESAQKRPRTSPVTPATLMKLAKTSLPTEDIPPISMDATEFLTRRVEVDPSTQQASSPPMSEDMTTPTLNSSRTPSLTPSLRPTKSQPEKSTSTPRMSATSGVRKRNIQSSPALMPKVSPSIKPLLPSGMLDTNALLLASKSNYQNIVEGNHSHLGLQYPEHLSTNLTSKRTSHKIAEQGRRNRINSALAEMATLLPAGLKARKGTDEGEGSPPGGGAGGAKGNGGKEQTSKAHTVELAIEYIKMLKKELEEVKEKLEVAEKCKEQEMVDRGGTEEKV